MNYSIIAEQIETKIKALVPANMGTSACLLSACSFAILPRSLSRGGLKLSDKKTDVIKAATEHNFQYGQLLFPQQSLSVTDSQHRKIGNGRSESMLFEVTAKIFRIHSNRCRHIAQ